MQNYVQPGKALDITMAAAFTKGDGVQVGTALFGVAVDTYASGAAGVIWTDGVFDLAKTTAQAYSAGDRIYWNSSTKKTTTTTGGNLQVGVAVAAAGSTDTTARVLLGVTAPTLA